MSTVDEQVLDDLGTLDDSFWSDYENAASGPGLPPPGDYILRFPSSLPDASFKLQNDPNDPQSVRPNVNGGKPYLEITLDNQQEGCVIVGGEFDGTQVRYLRVDTRRIPEYKGGKATGKILKESNATDVLQNFGTRDTITSVADWKQAFRNLCGQETPNTVRLTWGAYDKHASGKLKYLKAKDFGGKRVVTRTSATTFVTKKGETVNPGDTYDVFANLQLNYRGFSPRSK